MCRSSQHIGVEEKVLEYIDLEMLLKLSAIFNTFLIHCATKWYTLYQMQNLGDTGNHNKLFWSFERKAKTLGLGL